MRRKIDHSGFLQCAVSYCSYIRQNVSTVQLIACIADGSGYPRELRSPTRVQKAVQVARRMGRSLVARGFAAKSFAFNPSLNFTYIQVTLALRKTVETKISCLSFCQATGLHVLLSIS